MNNLVKALALAAIFAGLSIFLFVMFNKDDGNGTPKLPPAPASTKERVSQPEQPGVTTLQPAATQTPVKLTGTVHDVSGKALVGVEVTAYPIETGGSVNIKRAKEVRSDTAGAFVFPELMPGVYRFVARQTGFQEVRIDRPLAAENNPEPLAFILQSGMGISGYVRDEANKSIPGARVVAFPERVEKDAGMEERMKVLIAFEDIKSDPGIETTSDEAGYYQLTGLQAEPYRVQAFAPRFSMGELRHIRAGRTDANFFLKPGGVLQGTVSSTDGRPVPGALVSAYRMDPDGSDIIETVLCAIMPPAAERETDASGRFAFEELGGGKGFRIMARADGYQSVQIDKVVVEMGATAELPVTLEAGRVLSGIVLDPTGQPLAGAEVKVNLQGARPRAQVDSLDEGKLTDSTGTFVFDTLEEGNYRIVGTHPDYASTHQNRVQVEQDITLQLTIGGAASGMVSDSMTGLAIPGATVMVRDNAGTEKKAVADSSGNFLVRGISVANKGKVNLSVEAEGYARRSNEAVAVEEGIITQGLDYALDRNGQVSGIVQDAAGNPVMGAQVAVRRQFSPQVPVVVTVATGVRSDEQGRFSVPMVAPGDGSFLEGTHPGFLKGSSERFALEPGGNLAGIIVVMEKGGAISGVVVDDRGQPVPNATVAVQGEYASVDIALGKSTKSNERGEFSLMNLEAEEHTLVCTAPEYLRTELTGVKVVEGRTTPGIRVTLLRASFLSGYIMDTANHPIIGAEVSVIDNSDGLRRLKQRTDSNGFYKFDDLGQYPVEISATAKSYGKAWIQEQPVNKENVNLTLERLGSLRGRVIGTDGQAIRSFSVSPKQLVDGRPLPKTPAKTFQGNDGNFEYEGVEPGEYQVIVGAPGYALATIDGVNVASDRVADLGTITLDQGGKVSGYVVDGPTGQPINGVTVTVLGGMRMFEPPVPAIGQRSSPRRARQDTIRTDKDGYFEFIGLSVEAVALRFEHRNYMVLAEHNIPAGSEGVRFELDKGGIIDGVVYENGEPKSEAQVFLIGTSRNDRQLTDRKGMFTFSGLPTDTYELKVSDFGRVKEPGGRSQNIEDAPSKTVRVVQGDTSTVEFNLDAQ